MNITYKLPPDSGGWTSKNGKWFEVTDDIYLDGIDFQVKKEGSFRVTVDGFPRQGNRYLRTKILLAFPEAAMPFPLCHKEVVLKEAIKNDHFVFTTFRDPIDSMSSHLSGISFNKNDNTILDILKNVIYTKDDYIYIKKCFLFYIRMTDFIYNNINDIFVVPFESIAGDKNNSLMLTVSSLLPSTEYVQAHEVEPHSSRNTKMQEYLMTSKFYDIIESANESYNRVLSLSKTRRDRFVL